MTATTVFRDGVDSDFRQAANNDAGFGLGHAHWINSILQQSNARYYEGMSVPQRIIFKSITATPGNVHTLTLSHQGSKGNAATDPHAYDYLTSWQQAVNGANAIAPGQNLLFDLFNDQGGPEPGSDPQGYLTTCNNLHGGGFTAFVDAPDNLTPVLGNNIQTSITNYELLFGNRQVKLYGNAAFTVPGSMTFNGYTGSDNDVNYTLTWTSASTEIVIELAGHLAQGTETLSSPGGPIGYGPGRGASAISGGPYHFNLYQFDGASLGSQDNQIKGADILIPPPPCSIDGPSSACPSATNLNFSGPSGTGITYSWSFTTANGATFCSGTTAQTVCVNAGTGNFTLQLVVTRSDASSTCTKTVTVSDTTPPQITCPAPVSVQCDADIPAPNPGSVTATDNCGTPTVTFVGDVVSTATCPKTITRTYKATDAAGNMNTCTQIITVNDTLPPTVTSCPANTTVECPTVPSFGTPVFADTCDTNLTVTSVDEVLPATCPAIRVVRRTWTAKDDCNNQVTCSQTITVQDTTAPTIGSAGADATIQCPTVPTFTPPTATDACDTTPTIVEVSDVTTPGTCPGTYRRTKTWKAQDDCGNMSGTVSQTIMVVDTTAPTISALPGPTTIQCPAVPSFATPTASDACDASVALTFNDVTTPGSCPGTSSVTRTWTATDDCGNSATATQTINVIDNTAPVLAGVPASITIECGTAIPLAPTVTATDSCDSTVPVRFNQTSMGSCPTVVTRTWTATDDCNNTITRTQTITIRDTTKPVLTIPSGINLTCENCNDTRKATATDICDTSVDVTYTDQVTGTCPKVIKRTWKAKDDCGNETTATQTISCLPPSGVTNTERCFFDIDPTTSKQDFRLIYTQGADYPNYKVTSTNPGQYFYNVFYTGTPGSAANFVVSLPYPFETQGANPVHAYSSVGVSYSGSPAIACLTPGAEVPVTALPQTVDITGCNPVPGGTPKMLNINTTVPPSGFLFIAIHVDYALKGCGGLSKDANNNAVLASNLAMFIPNLGNYNFSVSGDQNNTASICNINAFKRNPGVGGMALKSVTTNAVPGATVTLTDPTGKQVGNALTDVDGYFQIVHKHTGKAANYQVKIVSGSFQQTQTVALKANGFVYVPFTVP